MIGANGRARRAPLSLRWTGLRVGRAAGIVGRHRARTQLRDHGSDHSGPSGRTETILSMASHTRSRRTSHRTAQRTLRRWSARCSTRSPRASSTVTSARSQRRSTHAGGSCTRSTRATCSRRSASEIASASVRASARGTSPASTGRSSRSTTMRRQCVSIHQSGASRAAACAALRWFSRSPRDRNCCSAAGSVRPSWTTPPLRRHRVGLAQGAGSCREDRGPTAHVAGRG